MGLDMYVHKFEKISENEVAQLLGKHVREMPEKYTFFSKEEFDEDPDKYGDLIPLITQVEMVQTLFDYKRCFSDYGIDEDKICGSHFSSDSVGWVTVDHKRVNISMEQYESYLYDANMDVYVLKGQMVAYWRKAYELDDYLQEIRIASRTMDFIAENQRAPSEDDIALWATDNCGYYEMSKREKMQLVEWMEKHPDDAQEDSFVALLNNEDAHLFYEAWW